MRRRYTRYYSIATQLAILEVIVGDVTGLALSEAVYGEVVLSWGVAANAAQYQIYRSLTSESGYTLFGTVSGTSFTDDTVSPDTDYYYQVRGVVDDVFGAYSSEETISTRLVGDITGLTLVESTPGQMALQWNDSANAGGYQVYRSIAGSSYSLIDSPSVSDFTDTDISPDTLYSYKIRAFGSGQFGLYSEVVMLLSDEEVEEGPTPSGTMVLTEFDDTLFDMPNADGGYIAVDENWVPGIPAHVICFTGGNGTSGTGSGNGGDPSKILVQALGAGLQTYNDWICNGEFCIFILLHTQIYTYYNDAAVYNMVLYAAAAYDCIGGKPWMWASSLGGVSVSNVYDNGHKADVLGSFHGAAELPNTSPDLSGKIIKYYAATGDSNVSFGLNNTRAGQINSASGETVVTVVSTSGVHSEATWGDPFEDDRHDEDHGALAWLEQNT